MHVKWISSSDNNNRPNNAEEEAVLCARFAVNFAARSICIISNLNAFDCSTLAKWCVSLFRTAFCYLSTVWLLQNGTIPARWHENLNVFLSINNNIFRPSRFQSAKIVFIRFFFVLQREHYMRSTSFESDYKAYFNQNSPATTTGHRFNSFALQTPINQIVVWATFTFDWFTVNYSKPHTKKNHPNNFCIHEKKKLLLIILLWAVIIISTSDSIERYWNRDASESWHRMTFQNFASTNRYCINQQWYFDCWQSPLASYCALAAKTKSTVNNFW